jgi:hypothetical protein
MRLFKNARRLAGWLYGWTIKKPIEILRLSRQKELYQAESYFPELSDKRRSTKQILGDQRRYILKYCTPNKYYFSYGLDVKSPKEQEEYVHFDYFFKRIIELNLTPKVNCCCILRDKILFNIFANGIGINTPQNVLYSANGKLYDFETRKELSAEQILQLDNQNLFCKLVDGECGRGIFKMEIRDGKIYLDGHECAAKEAYKMLTTGRYLAQSLINQHSQMAALHPQSINSLRIVTVKSLKDGVIRVWPSILRIGTGNSIVDNTSQGGLCVGIDFKTSHLRQWGFFKPQFGRKTDRHPDSGIVFSEFKIPFLKEVQDQAVYFHSMLPGMQSVGWDIAIGENGPVFIEGNDNWEINGPQICNGGLKNLFDEQMFK